MTDLEELIQQWISVRKGFIRELDLIPDDKMDYRATPDTRSVAELARHAAGTAASIVYQMCQDEFVPFSRPQPEMIALCLPNINQAVTKAELKEALLSAIEKDAARIREYDREKLNTVIQRFDGTPTTKFAMLWFSIAHEMYHRGQLTIFLRLLGHEPQLTQVFRKLMAGAANK